MKYTFKVGQRTFPTIIVREDSVPLRFQFKEAVKRAGAIFFAAHPDLNPDPYFDGGCPLAIVEIEEEPQ